VDGDRQQWHSRRGPCRGAPLGPGIRPALNNRVYETHCSRCHGETGAGDGPDARKREPFPARFTDVRPSFAVAAEVIHEGVPGTAMEAWPLLTPGEIQAVTLYLRSFYQGPERHRAALPEHP
jgi:cytochrome c oxidase cbb3-type subunit II